MKKTQKILMGVFLTLSLLPELLWSPVINIVCSIFQNTNIMKPLRPNFLMSADNVGLLLLFVFLEFISLVGVLILLTKANLNIFAKSFLIFITIILVIIAGAAFYIAFSLRHGIGF
jgi:hypothetical protein